MIESVGVIKLPGTFRVDLTKRCIGMRRNGKTVRLNKGGLQFFATKATGMFIIH